MQACSKIELGCALLAVVLGGQLEIHTAHADDGLDSTGCGRCCGEIPSSDTSSAQVRWCAVIPEHVRVREQTPCSADERTAEEVAVKFGDEGSGVGDG